LWAKGISSFAIIFFAFEMVREVPDLIADVTVATLSFGWLSMTFSKYFSPMTPQIYKNF
jgi:hypothetical protein